MNFFCNIFTCYVIAISSVFAELPEGEDIKLVASGNIALIEKGANNDSPYLLAELSIIYRTGVYGKNISLTKSKELALKAHQFGNSIGTFNLGNIAIHEGNASEMDKYYMAAFPDLKKLADLGEPVASFCLGELYATSEPKDLKLAAQHYQSAANKGYANAKAALGSFYMKGMGVEKDFEKGINLLLEASESQSAIAALNLGVAYKRGDGLPANEYLSYYWTSIAAEMGHHKAQHLLGMKYLAGEGIKKNPQKGKEWLTKSSVISTETEPQNLPEEPRIEQNITQTAEQPIPPTYQEPVRTQEPVFETLQKKDAVSIAETPGSASEQRELAKNYYLGKGIEKDLNKAFQWMEKAAVGGDRVAQRYLGIFLMKGVGCDKNPGKGIRQLQKSAKNGDAQALRILKKLLTLKKN